MGEGNWGLHWMTRIYNIYVFSVLKFIVQFYAPTQEIRSLEKQSLARCLPGPTSWFCPRDAFKLKDWYGFRFQFNSIEHVSLAARMRRRHAEDWDVDISSKSRKSDRQHLHQQEVVDLVIRFYISRDKEGGGFPQNQRSFSLIGADRPAR